MGVNNNWRPVETMGDWMRDIEKRLMHEERRRSVPHPIDVVGRGFRAYALAVTDWNAEGPTVGGHFHSISNQVVNSPDDTKNWMGIVQSNSFGQGLQRVWEYITTTEEPSPDPAFYTRAFHTHEDGSREYLAWTQATGGGGGGAPSGPAGGDLSGTYPNPQIAADAVGATEIANNAVGNTELADNAVTSAKVQDGSLTAADLAPGTIPSNLPPSGPAGGDLTGTYPNPEIGAGKVGTPELADGAVNSTKIADGTITDTDVAATNKDGAAGTASMRTLGTGATQAAAGNHTHTGMVVSFNGPLPALTAGTWTTVTHNLNRWPVAAMFYESGTEVVLDFRIGAGASVNAIEVRSDLAVGAGVYTVLVTG